jgi:hypothetical protein
MSSKQEEETERGKIVNMDMEEPIYEVSISSIM